MWPFPPQIMKVEHGVLKDELSLKLAIFHFHDESSQIHDLVTQKPGSMLTIDKNWEICFFSQRQVAWYKNRWKRMLWTTYWVKVSWDQGSKNWHISKLRTFSLPSETNSLSTKKRNATSNSIYQLIINYELNIYCKTSNTHTPWKFKAGTWSRLARNAIIKSSFVLTSPSTVSAGKGGGETEEPWHDGCGMTDGRTLLLFGMTWTESKQTVPLKLCKQFVVPNPISSWPSCCFHMFSFVLLITLNKTCVLHSGSWFLSVFNLLILGCISINVDENAS